MTYIYESHMGGIYATSYALDYEERYCDQCGDCDSLIGEAETVGELLIVLSNCIMGSYVSIEYMQEWVMEHFPDLDIYFPPTSICSQRDWDSTNDEENPIYCNFFDIVCDCWDMVYSEDDKPEYTTEPCCDECTLNYEYELIKLNSHLDMNEVI